MTERQRLIKRHKTATGIGAQAIVCTPAALLLSFIVWMLSPAWSLGSFLEVSGGELTGGALMIAACLGIVNHAELRLAAMPPPSLPQWAAFERSRQRLDLVTMVNRVLETGNPDADYTLNELRAGYIAENEASWPEVTSTDALDLAAMGERLKANQAELDEFDAWNAECFPPGSKPQTH